jgi:hypothetical protein
MTELRAPNASAPRGKRRARLLAQQGHRNAARTLLAAIYGWFTDRGDSSPLVSLNSTRSNADMALARYNEAVARRAGLGEAPEDTADDLDGLRVELATTEAEIVKHAEIAAERKTLATICAELERDACHAIVFAALEWAINETRARSVSEASGWLKALMGEFLQAAGRSETPFFYAVGNRCDMGWQTPEGHEILVQALNKASYTLFIAALTAAVAILRGAPVRVVMVESADCDGRTLEALLRGLAQLADRLTAVIVETPHAVYLDTGLTIVPDGWQVQRLDAQPRAAAA